MALHRTPEADVHNYGCVGGLWEPSRSHHAPPASLGDGKADAYASSEPSPRLSITMLVEKPNADFARSRLRIPGVVDGTFLTAFGLYIISDTRALLWTLDELLRARGDSLGAPPLQLTEALNTTRIESGLCGVLLEGERCDIGGEPRAYLRAIGALTGASKTRADGAGA